MKAHISLKYFNNDFGYSKINVNNVKDDEIQYYIDRASQFVNGNIVGNAIVSGIREGKYKQDNEGNIVVNPQNITTDEAKIETEKLEAYFECVALLTKFAIDTGYDFLSGSMSRNMGGESYSENLNFQESFANLITIIKGNLANFD